MADPVEAAPFGVRFQQAIDVLRGKVPEASGGWDSLAGVVHAKVFTVAGSTSADLSRDIQQALVDAKTNGTTITEFRKQFDQTVARHGWSYRGKRGWRTRVIFDANMRSAHMAGRWQQLVDNAQARPYLQYRTAGDARVRPQHRQWNGLIYPVGNAFWHTHYPPNGWRCRCTVRAFSQADLAGRGLQVSKPYPVQYREVVDADGLATDRVPVGIDPGWDHNVGQSWIQPELALGRKLARLPRELQGAVVAKTMSPGFQAALSARWNAFQTAVAAGTVQAQAAHVLGFADGPTLDGLAAAAPDLQLQSSALVAYADQAAAVATGAGSWPAAWVADLPAELRSYRAVLWDRAKQRMVIVPMGQLPNTPADVLPTAVLLPNANSQAGHGLALQSLGSAPAAQLANSQRYRVLSGSLGTTQP